MSAIERLDPRRDMALIRERIELLIADGVDPTPSMADLAGRNAIALADLVVGPRAISHTAWVQAAMNHLDELESAIAPNGLYRRLAALNAELCVDVLSAASRRHPSATWLVDLSRKTEGESAGFVHLMATSGHPSFAQNCWAHAAAGHLPGMVAVAAATGRPEIAAALAANGHLNAAGRATVVTLEKTPESPVVAMIAAAWGPDPVPVLQCAIPHLCSKSAAESLLQQCRGYPSLTGFLETVIKAMVQT